MKGNIFIITILLLLLVISSVFPELNRGSTAPEIDAEHWLNTEKQVSLKDLKGKIVVLEFWATWCGPCIDAIPHIIEMYEEYSTKDVVFISLTREDRYQAKIDSFIDNMNMEYIIGTGSSTSDIYGVQGIPHAFIIDKDSKIAWQGHPMDSMEYALDEILGLITYTKTGIEAYRKNNNIYIKYGFLVNDTEANVTIRLYHPDSPQSGIHTSYKLEPGEEVSFWDGEYAIGTDWGIDIETDNGDGSICFLGDIVLIGQDKFLVLASKLINKK